MKYSARFQAFNDFRRDLREQKVAARMRLIAPKEPAPIMSQKQRQGVVQEVKASMDKWSLSPFEREGDTRAALRTAFCLGGNGWDSANHEAERIIAAALEGVERPSWEEGQWIYAVSEDYCKWCQAPMELGCAGRYCSSECAKAAMVHRDFGEGAKATGAYRDAYRTVRRFSAPTKTCEFCKKNYHPHIDVKDQKYCSVLCTTKAKNARALANPKTSTCVVCREHFLVFSLKRAKYCSTACSSTGARIANGIWDPKRLNRQVFEQLIVGAVVRPAWLTAERFDEMVAA